MYQNPRERAEDSPYWIGYVPVPSTHRSSSPAPRSYPSLEQRDVGTDTNVANIVTSALVGTVQIYLQAKGNSIAASALQLAWDAAVGRVQTVVTGVGATGSVNGGVISVGTEIGGTAAEAARMGAGAVVDGANHVGGVTSEVAQTGSNTAGTASRWLPQLPLRFCVPNLNPFRRASSNPPAMVNETEDDEPTLPERDARRPNGTLELVRNRENGTMERIAIVDERLFPTISSLPHEDLVQSMIEIAEGFEIGSDTDTNHTDADFEDMEIEGTNERHSTLLDRGLIYDIRDNEWTAEIDGWKE